MAGKVKKQPSFEDQLAQLEKIVEAMEGGTLTLDEQVKLYQEGMRLSSEMNQRLEATSARLTEIGQEKERAASTLLDGLEEG